MATGPEHYREAEKQLRHAKKEDAGSDLERYHLAAAQVHATLALVASTTMDHWRSSAEHAAWREAFGIAGTDGAEQGSLGPGDAEDEHEFDPGPADDHDVEHPF